MSTNLQLRPFSAQASTWAHTSPLLPSLPSWGRCLTLFLPQAPAVADNRREGGKRTDMPCTCLLSLNRMPSPQTLSGGIKGNGGKKDGDRDMGSKSVCLTYPETKPLSPCASHFQKLLACPHTLGPSKLHASYSKTKMKNTFN